MKIQASMETLKCWSPNQMFRFSLSWRRFPPPFWNVNIKATRNYTRRGKVCAEERQDERRVFTMTGNDSRNCIKRRTQRRNKIALSTFPNVFPPSIVPVQIFDFLDLLHVFKTILIFRTKLSKLFFDLIPITKHFFFIVFEDFRYK